MAWQEPVALAIVAATVAAFVLRRVRGRGRRAHVCGCAGASHRLPAESIIFSARKGEKPRIIVREVARSKDSLA
jgi:hypothetical protein